VLVFHTDAQDNLNFSRTILYENCNTGLRTKVKTEKNKLKLSDFKQMIIVVSMQRIRSDSDCTR